MNTPVKEDAETESETMSEPVITWLARNIFEPVVAYDPVRSSWATNLLLTELLNEFIDPVFNSNADRRELLEPVYAFKLPDVNSSE